MKFSVYTSQHRLDTSSTPAGVGVHESPGLARVQVHGRIGLCVHTCASSTVSLYVAGGRLHLHGGIRHKRM